MPKLPILIVVLIALVVGGYFIYTNYSQNRTASWKTYTNTEYKYTLKYPPDWTVEAQDHSDVNTFSAPLFNSPCDYDKGELCPQIFIIANHNKSDSDFTVGSAGKVSNKVMTKLDGEDAQGFEYLDTHYGVSNGGRLQYFLITNHHNTAFYISYEESQKDKTFRSASDWQNKQVFDQVMSTFKFIP